MPQLTLVTVLFCGQGMTALVEVYDNGVDDGRPNYLVLIDCGGDKAEDEVIEYIAERVFAHRISGLFAGRLDAVLISHRDRDHHEILKALGERLTEKVYVDAMWAGGYRWGQKYLDSLEDFIDRVTFGPGGRGTIEWSAQKFTDYQGHPPTQIAGHAIAGGAMSVRRLLSNYGKGPNDSSAIFVVDNGVSAVVLPGDATHQTMSQVRAMYAAGRPAISPVLLLELPHHGAIFTAIPNYSFRGKYASFDTTIIRAFGTDIDAAHLVASAGPLNSYRHPTAEIMDELVVPRMATGPQHDYGAFVFGTKSWQNISTPQGKFCTVTHIPVEKPGSNVRARFTEKGRKLEPVDQSRLAVGNVQANLNTGSVTYIPVNLTAAPDDPVPTALAP